MTFLCDSEVVLDITKAHLFYCLSNLRMDNAHSVSSCLCRRWCSSVDNSQPNMMLRDAWTRSNEHKSIRLREQSKIWMLKMSVIRWLNSSQVTMCSNIHHDSCLVGHRHRYSKCKYSFDQWMTSRQQKILIFYLRHSCLAATWNSWTRNSSTKSPKSTLCLGDKYVVKMGNSIELKSIWFSCLLSFFR